MSRSRNKYAKFPICCGSNTEFYRERNRSTRAKNRQMLRNLIGKMDIEDVADVIYNFTNHMNDSYDRWLEPTDGSSIAKEFMDSVTCINYPHYDEDYEHREWYHNIFEKYKRK